MSETISTLPQPRYGALSFGAALRSWGAELAPFPNRWRRAARVAFVTAIGAGLMATLQIANPLGLTLLVSLAAPEFAFSVTTGIVFLIGAATSQTLALFLAGALVDSPALLIAAFIAIVGVSTYLIYGVPALGRLWLWAQIPSVTAFYLVVFDRRTLGWDNAQMWAGTAIAVALMLIFNNFIWPSPAESVLAESLEATVTRSRNRLRLLMKIFLGDASPANDRGAASKLSYHLILLKPALRKAASPHKAGEVLAGVMVAERIHNEMDRLCLVACEQAGAGCAENQRHDLLAATDALEGALDGFIARIGRANSDEPAEQSYERFRELAGRLPEAGAMGAVARHLRAIGDLLASDERELPFDTTGAVRSPRFHQNKFLMRFCARHTVAMTIAFVAGLFDNNAAIHAALWLLMIGGPPSHGATARKFTMRAIGASGALVFAAIGTMILAPNFTSPPPYMAAIFIGVLLMTYPGEGGGKLSYLAIGATAFVIAFSGPGPRPEVMGSIWTIWGISLGMILRAIVSVVSVEHANRTLAEEMERPVGAIAALARGFTDRNEEVAMTMQVTAGIEEMLEVAADAQLQGPSSGIDARNLVDALDTMRRLAFSLENLQRPANATGNEFDDMVRARTQAWYTSIRGQLEPGQLHDAPLRTMVAAGSNLDPARQIEAAPDPDRQHLAELIRTLETQLATVRLD